MVINGIFLKEKMKKMMAPPSGGGGGFDLKKVTTLEFLKKWSLLYLDFFFSPKTKRCDL